ncbi:MAG TPA: non-ribosomal peptide synthetase [Steroidobacteraceae bacterium]|jgi:acyl-CoA synthetase (AMP-forming)/AMP-acid ligase II|nr:non-ribosomal peptide synthetase [Steroidobacteraceae bacterium]
MSANSPITAPTLAALMDAHRGSNRVLTYLQGERETHSVPYGEIHQRALGILHRLQRLGARAGDRMILLLSDNEPFVDAFWAAVLGGIIAVPVAPGISDEHRHKLLRIARRLREPFLYTEQRLLERIGAFVTERGGEGDQDLYAALRARSFLVDDLDEVARSGKPHRASPGDVAFIQFSSGSTSEPKGIVLTHANLMANVRGASEVAHFNADDVSLSWMPLTHDMGLIGFHLVMLANHVHSHLMPTELFVRRPLLWLQLATRTRASLLCSPNFGYRHYLKALGERSLDGLDLGSVRLIFNGAEPISVELCEQFLARLASAALAPETMYPVYGLAEASLAVSFPQPGRPLQACGFERARLGVGALPQPLPAGSRDAVRLASVGRAIPGCELRIATADDQSAPSGSVGHIQIRGDNVTRGYFEDRDADAAAFTAERWLRTGDLGVIYQGQLYVTGRDKEIVFVNGQNYYPHDLERMVEDLPGLELGKVVVAGVRASGAPADELVAFVLHRGTTAQFLPLARELAHRIGEHAGVEVGAVVPVRRIPKTTSGKVQRHLLAEQYLAGEFGTELSELARLRAVQPIATLAADQIEQRLLDICENELDGRALEVDESLFDIGASSLKLIAIHERIEQLWPGAIDVTEIFEHPSVRALARLIEHKRGEAPT